MEPRPGTQDDRSRVAGIVDVDGVFDLEAVEQDPQVVGLLGGAFAADPRQ